MRRPLSCLLLAVTALGTATCCPSLFLTVTKGDPSPLLGLPAPKPAAIPLVMPAHLQNRFDVLSRTTPAPKYDDFEDLYSGPRGLTSILALAQIKKDFGDPNSPDLLMPEEAVPACVLCTGNKCKALLLRATPFAPDQHPTLTIPGTPAQQRTVVLSQAVSEANDTNRGCHPVAGDLVVVLNEPLDQVSAFDTITVTLRRPGTTTVTGFVHLSDVQLRDPDIRVGDRVLSRHLDKLISSFEYDRDLEVYDRYVVQSLFATINQMHQVMPEISFVIHTGDAIDAGVTTELREFHRLFDLLDLPAYDVLGNHDVLIFGNMLATRTDHDDSCITARSEALSGSTAVGPFTALIPNKICIHAAISCPSCLPGEAEFVAGTTHDESHARFMKEFKTHSPADVLRQPDDPVEQDAARTYCPAPFEGEQPIRIQGTTRQHGFDLNSAGASDPPPGYYAFANDIQLGGETRHALNVALDTNDLDRDEGGKTGRINARQLRWLKATLACVTARHPKDVVFVFGHHGLQELHAPAGAHTSIEGVLAASPNVVGYFYGHDHAHGICRGAGSCQHFWEVMTGSVIEFPQEARLVRLKEVGRGLAFLELVTFGERLDNGDDALTRAVELGHRGARHDYCANHEASLCSDDLRPYRDDARHTSARLFFQLPEVKARLAAGQAR
jgi:hypothetical protein